jgi:hypothetical protein
MIALNHAFLEGIAYRPVDAGPFTLIEHVRRRTRALPHVHPDLPRAETGQGPFIQWANRMLRDPERRALVELLLQTTAGPWIQGSPLHGLVEPSVSELPSWLAETVRILLEVAPSVQAPALCGLVSPSPTGGVDYPSFKSEHGVVVPNWLNVDSFEHDLTATAPDRTTLEVLRQAETEMAGQLVVLPSAVRSAERWTRDCPAAVLHRALLGLEHYAAALAESRPDGARWPRERCTERYHERTGTPMSQESAATSRQPTKRRQRTFDASPHGPQYFDIHAKPGNLTRIHVWVFVDDQGVDPPIIYLGHCGRHLD